MCGQSNLGSHWCDVSHLSRCPFTFSLVVLVSVFLTVSLTCLASFLPQVSDNVKFSTDATKPDIESWLIYIQFASLAQQHNLTLCQVDEQVCGDTFTDNHTNINILRNFSRGGELVDDMTLNLWWIFLWLCECCQSEWALCKSHLDMVATAKFPTRTHTHTHALCCRVSLLSVCSFSYCVLASTVQGPQGMIKGGPLKWLFSSHACVRILRYIRNAVVFLLWRCML